MHAYTPALSLQEQPGLPCTGGVRSGGQTTPPQGACSPHRGHLCCHEAACPGSKPPEPAPLQRMDQCVISAPGHLSSPQPGLATAAAGPHKMKTRGWQTYSSVQAPPFLPWLSLVPSWLNVLLSWAQGERDLHTSPGAGPTRWPTSGQQPLGSVLPSAPPTVPTLRPGGPHMFQGDPLHRTPRWSWDTKGQQQRRMAQPGSHPCEAPGQWEWEHA